MILGDLIGTSDPEATLNGGERTLLTATRGAAVLGATLVVLGAALLVLVPLLRGGLSFDAGAGGAGLVIGGGLWVLAQGLVARWILHRDLGPLLQPAACVPPAVAAASVGIGVTAGLVWSQLLVLVATLMTLALAVLVWRVEPALVALGRLDTTESGELSWAGELLHAMAQIAVALGLLLGGLSAWGLVHYTANLHDDWNLLGAWIAGAVLLVAVLWTLPHAVLLRWTGGGWGAGRGIVAVLAAVPVVAVALFGAAVVVPGWVLGLGLVAAVVMLEIVLGVLVWTDRSESRRG